ncbi:MAG: TRAP transporter substrate-binding protein, partial [Pseudomonadota bacterium]
RLVAAGAAAAMLVTTASAGAQAADVTLTLHHFLSPKSATHSKFLAPWAKQVEADSNGRIKIELFPSMAMGGKPPELYRQLRDGAADLVWTLPGYTPGVFPRVEVFELPGVHRGSAKATTLAIQDTFDAIKDDFKDIKPILVHVHAGNALHLVNGCVETIADMRGLKLRTPTRTGGWMISSWGAEPVGMPVPALPQALSKGAIDGALIPFEIVPPLKVHELTKCSMSGDGALRFGTSVFLFGMNKGRYDGLPDDLKAVIDKNSGAAIAEKIGALWDTVEAPGEKLQSGTGSPVKTLSAAATEDVVKRSEDVVARWVKEVSGRGIDGEALVAAARKAVAQQGQ